MSNQATNNEATNANEGNQTTDSQVASNEAANNEAASSEATSNQAILSSEGDLVELEMEENIQKILFYSLDTAASKLAENGSFDPFTTILAGEDVFVNSYPNGEDIDYYELAAQSVNVIAHLAEAYVFCYDGYIELADEEIDAIIAEVGKKHEDQAFGFGLAYGYSEDGSFYTDEGMANLGEVENLFDPELVEEAEMIQAAYQQSQLEEDEEEEVGY